MARVNTYLNFQGQAEEAFAFYAGSRKRTGKGQRRTPSWASRPADGSTDDSSAEAAVIAAGRLRRRASWLRSSLVPRA
jgi:hypothetical protein